MRTTYRSSGCELKASMTQRIEYIKEIEKGLRIIKILVGQKDK